MRRLRYACFSCAALLVAATATPAPAAEQYTLQSRRQPGDTYRVGLRLDVEGTLLVAQDGQQQSLPLTVTARLRYHERLLSRDERSRRSFRLYERAEATIRVAGNEFKPRLAAERALIAADSDGQTALLTSPRGPLTREQLDLLDVPGNSLLLSDLLPEGPVVVGGYWKHTTDLMAMLLGLDAASASDVQSELLEVVGGKVAKVAIRGHVDGAIDGAASEVALDGAYEVDLEAGRIRQLALTIRENRGVGHTGPGLEVTAKLALAAIAAQPPPTLARAATGELADAPREPRLLHESKPGKYRFLYDRRWHVLDPDPQSLSLRLVDRGELLAQCNVARMQPPSGGKTRSLEEFQAEVKKVLGKRFGEFLVATKGRDDHGQRVYRLVVEGEVGELPIQWNYYLVGDDAGHEVALAFTLESGQRKRFGRADLDLVGTLELTGGEATAEGPTPVERK